MDILFTMSDEELVVSYAKGNDSAFNTLLDRHKQSVYNYILYTIRDNGLAEDIFQDTFIKAIITIKQGKLPPLSLQIVLENALFQNKISKEAPLVFKIQSMNGGLIVVNNIQPKLMTDAGDIDSGLDILVKKYQLMNQPSVEIIEEGNQRMVVLPFVNLISENPS